MTHVSPEISRQIQQRIDALETDGIGRWPLRVCKEELNALPLHGNQVYLWAVRPDGEVLCVDHEAFGHPAEPERDAVTLYTVFSQGAREYPELRALVPPPPDGVRECEACGGTGRGDGHTPPLPGCLRCDGLGWYVPAPLPVQGWMERIDRGDQVTIIRETERREWLYAGRIAGHYVCRAGDEHNAAPATPESRSELEKRLRSWATGHPHSITWTANPTEVPDPWESAGHTLFFEGRDAQVGGFEAEYERLPDGTVRVTETMLNDWDPAGWMPSTSTEHVLSDVEARSEFLGEMEFTSHASPFPAILPREPAR
ncbi:MAG TPA: hypothetical protein VFJ82_03685 [Longimicrobium sp.]|nr:hypothetical protein [Longimicrobium sp.]